MAEFSFEGGAFLRVGAAWVEYDRMGRPINGFEQLAETHDVVMLFDKARGTFVRLAKHDGRSEVMEVAGSWRDLYAGTFAP